MSNWTAVSSELSASPLRADPSDFYAASTHFATVARNVEELLGWFGSLSRGEPGRFEGEAARAFAKTLEDITRDIGDLPTVAHDIEDVFRDHARALDEIRVRADNALAVALTSRSQRDAAKTTATTETGTLSAIRKQLENLRIGGATPDDPQVTTLEAKVVSASGRAHQAQQALTGAEGSLRRAVDRYHEFHHEEVEINKSTAARLDRIDLRSLADPSNLDKVASWGVDQLKLVGDFVVELASDYVDFYKAIFAGEWEEALWRLNDILRAAVIIVAVVALFTPVGWAGLALAAALFATTAALYAFGQNDPTRWENSETGQVMSREQVGKDFAAVVLAGFTFGVGKLQTARLREMSSLKLDVLESQAKRQAIQQYVFARDGLKVIDYVSLPDAYKDGRQSARPELSMPPPYSLQGPSKALIGACQ